MLAEIAQLYDLLAKLIGTLDHHFRHASLDVVVGGPEFRTPERSQVHRALLRHVPQARVDAFQAEIGAAPMALKRIVHQLAADTACYVVQEMLVLNLSDKLGLFHL